MTGPNWRLGAADWLCAALIAAIALAPIVHLFTADTAIESVGGSPSASLHAGRLLMNTAALAVLTTAASFVWAFPAGLFLGLVRPRRMGLWLAVLLLPLFLPPYILAAAWIDALGPLMPAVVFASQAIGQGMALPKPFDLLGAALIQSLTLYPVILLGVYAGCARIDRRAVEAARVHLGPWRAARTAVWPALRGPIGASLAIAAGLTLIAFPVPSLLLVDVYPVEIYTQFNLSYDARLAAQSAMPLAVMGMVPLMCLWLIERGRATGLRPMPLAAVRIGIGARIAGTTWISLVAGLAMGVPIASLVFRAWPLSSFAEAWSTAREELGVSLFVSALTATLVTVLVFAAAALARWGRGAAGAAANLSAVTLLLSGPITGIALIGLWNRPSTGPWLYDTFLILVVACAARSLFIAYRLARASVTALPSRWDEAAAVSGLSPFACFARIHFPALAPVIGALWMLVFALSFTEADASVLVAPPGWTTLPVRIYTLLHYGPSRIVAALSLIVLFVSFLAAVAALALTRRVGDLRP